MDFKRNVRIYISQLHVSTCTSYLTTEIRQFLQIETNMTNKVTCTETIFYFISVKQTKRIYCVGKKNPKYYPLKKLLIFRKSKIWIARHKTVIFFLKNAYLKGIDNTFNIQPHNFRSIVHAIWHCNRYHVIHAKQRYKDQRRANHPPIKGKLKKKAHYYQTKGHNFIWLKQLLIYVWITLEVSV